MRAYFLPAARTGLPSDKKVQSAGRGWLPFSFVSASQGATSGPGRGTGRGRDQGEQSIRSARSVRGRAGADAGAGTGIGAGAGGGSPRSVRAPGSVRHGHGQGPLARQGSERTTRGGRYGTLVIDVIDQGAGISPENQKRLFNEVVQFNPEKLQKGGGSGFGLFLTKGIVDLHEGKIGVWSAGEGHGATFTLELPLMRKSLGGEAEEEGEEEGAVADAVEGKVSGQTRITRDTRVRV